MNKVRVTLVAICVLGAVLVAVSCGGGESGRAVKVTEKEWSVLTDVQRVKSGEVNFEDTNEGKVTHEFVIVKSDVALDELPLDADGKVDEDQVETIGEIEDILPGSTHEATFTLEPGKYILICNIAATEADQSVLHYKNGMRTPLVVE